MKSFKPIPGDGGLEGIVDEARRRQEFARVGHADKGVAPDPRGAFEMRIGSLCGLRLSAMIGAALERACHPCIRRMIPGFEPENHDRCAAISRAGIESLLRIEDTAV